MKKVKKSFKITKNSNEKILSVKISTLTKYEILKIVLCRIKQNKQTVIFTPNPQMLLGAEKSRENRIILNSADINIPDGIGLIIASSLKGGKVKKRISGIDLATDILKISQNRGYKVFLLGAKQGVAKKAKKNLKKLYPRLNICGTHHGYFKNEENFEIIKAINQSKADIIFVCMGYPEQEKWINENAYFLKSVKLCMGLGGSLDVWSQNVKRAPAIFQVLCLEWLYRTVKDPKRAKIFWDIPVFLFKVLK